MEDPEEKNPCFSIVGVDYFCTIADYMVPCSSARIGTEMWLGGIQSRSVEVVDPSLFRGFCTKSSLILVTGHITLRDIMKWI